MRDLALERFVNKSKKIDDALGLYAKMHLYSACAEFDP